MSAGERATLAKLCALVATRDKKVAPQFLSIMKGVIVYKQRDKRDLLGDLHGQDGRNEKVGVMCTGLPV